MGRRNPVADRNFPRVIESRFLEQYQPHTLSPAAFFVRDGPCALPALALLYPQGWTRFRLRSAEYSAISRLARNFSVDRKLEMDLALGEHGNRGNRHCGQSRRMASELSSLPHRHAMGRSSRHLRRNRRTNPALPLLLVFWEILEKAAPPPSSEPPRRSDEADPVEAAASVLPGPLFV